MGKLLTQRLKEMLDKQRQSMRGKKDSWSLYLSTKDFSSNFMAKKDLFIKRALQELRSTYSEEEAAFNLEMVKMTKQFFQKHGVYNEVLSYVANDKTKFYDGVAVALRHFQMNELTKYICAYMRIYSTFTEETIRSNDETWSLIHKDWENTIFALARQISKKRKGREQHKDNLIARITAHFSKVRHSKEKTQENPMDKYKNRFCPRDFYDTISYSMPDRTTQNTIPPSSHIGTASTDSFMPYPSRLHLLSERVLNA